MRNSRDGESIYVKVGGAAAILAVLVGLGSIIVEEVNRETYIQYLKVVEIGTCKGGTSAFEEEYRCQVKASEAATGETYFLEVYSSLVKDQVVTRKCYDEPSEDGKDTNRMCYKAR